MQQYLKVMKDILDNGTVKTDRTGVGTRSLFGCTLRCELSDGFPLLTTKRVNMRAVLIELLWMLRGETSVRWLNERGVHIWDEWADTDGELGPVYGAQWRRWRTLGGGYIDQIANLIDGLKANPDGRRHIVSAWNVAEIGSMALPPCHVMFQMEVSDGELSCLLFQRSNDFAIGSPFNIASYALLTEMVAQVVGLKAGSFVYMMGDTHLYTNHWEGAAVQITRTPYPLPRLALDPDVKNILDFDEQHVTIEGYRHHPAIKYDIAV